MHALPTGTVTFLFTDIEGSTRMWEAHPGAMRAALERHDVLLRQAVTDAGGTVFKTVGDAFCVAFPDALGALDAAARAQKTLLAEPWPAHVPLRVRMALHTGLAQERDRDYFGPPLNRVERLLSAGHGGQVLLSASTYELVRDILPSGVALRDLGLHRLRDLDRPEQIFQVVSPALPAPETFPPLRTLDNTPNNLPQQVTSFIGREKEIAEVKARLGRTRLLSLIGAGGSGKTRLALQAAADVLDGCPDGVWLVELAALSDPARVGQSIAQVLGYPEQAGQTPAQTLSEQLKDKHLLLILDNCEHVLNACAHLVSGLLRACPGVRLLATSREPLGIAGEATYRVPSLSLPSPQQRKTATPESLNQFEAVRLFLERAEMVRSDFAVTNANAPALAQLCCRVDGIPLAIELAAARVRSLSVEQINDKLGSQFRLLIGGDRSALPRQQTLRALVDWSYDLLNDPEKTLLARLSVFGGGWTLAAAESVCGFAPLDEAEILDLLTSLVDKSLIVAEEAENETRYCLLETLKQYGAEKLTGSGETQAVQQRHADFFVGVVEEAEPQLRGPDQLAWLNRLDTEHDNLRAAFAHGFAAEDDPDAALRGLRLAGALWRFWYVRGYLTEGREQFARVLERDFSGESRAARTGRAVALGGAGFLAVSQGDYARAGTLLDESLRLARALESKPQIALSLNYLGNLVTAQGDYARARSLYEESLALRRELGDTSGVANSLGNLGSVASRQGEYALARAFFEESLALFRTFGEQRGIAHSLLSLANLSVNQGEYGRAHTLHEECLALFRALGDKSGMAYGLNDLGEIAYHQGEYPKAQARFEESLALFGELGDTSGVANTQHNLGMLAVRRGDAEGARGWYEKSLTLFCALGESKGTAYALEGFASVRLYAGNAHDAVLLFGAADALRSRSGGLLAPGEQAEYDAWLAQAQAALGEEAYSAAWDKGRALGTEQAVETALAKPAFLAPKATAKP